MLLEHDIPFKFDEDCLKAFEELKKTLITAPDWSLPFELMCDANNYSVQAVLGQRKDKIFHSIYYTSKTLLMLSSIIPPLKKELLTIVFVFDKFKAYLVSIKVTIYTDHAAIKYLILKKIPNQGL